MRLGKNRNNSMKLLVSMFFLFLLGCSNTGSNLSKQGRLLRRDIFDFEKEMKKEGYSLLEYGGEADKGKICKLEVYFTIDSELTATNATETIVKFVDKFIQKINADEKLRPYLSNYPFTAKNIDMTIFGTAWGKILKNPGSISYVSSIKGQVSYPKENPSKDPGPSITLLEEPFKEAVQKLKDQNFTANQEISGGLQ